MSGSTVDQSALDPLESSEGLARKAAKGGIITIASQLCRVAIQLVGTVVVSRLLTPADFGLLAMAMTVTGFIAMFTDMGLSNATIQRETLDQRVISTLFFANLLVGCTLFIIAIAVAPVAAALFGDPRVMPLIVALATAIPISAAGAQHAAILARRMAWSSVQAVGILSQLAGVAAVIGLALTLNNPYFALAAQSVVAASVSTFCFWCLSGWRPSFTARFGEARSEIGFGAYLSSASMVNYFHDQFDNALLGWRWGAVELGFYSRAYSLLQMPLTLITGTISQVAFPSLSRLAYRQEDWARAFLAMIAVSTFGTMAMCCMLFVASDPLVELLLGHQWQPVGKLFRYLMVASIFGAASSICAVAYMSRGKAKANFYWVLFASPIFALSYVIGLPWAAVGIATAYSIAMAILSPLYLAVTAKVTGFSFIEALKRIVPFMVAAGVSCYVGSQILARIAVDSVLMQLLVGSVVAFSVYLSVAVPAICLLPGYQDFRKLVIRLLLRRGPKGISG